MTQDIQLSHNFWLHEFLLSQQATRMGMEIVPTLEEINDLRRLCTLLLQPIRDSLGRTMTITSGLRPVWLNKAIGGASNSEHIYARAADFIVQGMTPYAVTMKISTMNLPFNQLIHEGGHWTHISVPRDSDKPRGEVMTARFVSGKAQYSTGVRPA